MKLKLIVAMCKNMGIGLNNNIPWKIKKDLIYFSSKTCGLYGKYLKNKEKNDPKTFKDIKNIKKNAIVMGKNTWLSLPKYPQPLPNRDNIIISKTIREDTNGKKLLNMNYVNDLCLFNCIFSTFNDNEFEINKVYDLNMYFSSISRMIDYCILSDDEDNYTTIDKNTTFKKHEMIEMREINEKSIIENNNTKYEKNYAKTNDKNRYDEVWIIGGSQIYNSFIKENNKNNIDNISYIKNNDILISEFCITYIDKYYECDTFFPRIENMNLYYISSFLKCENIDENTGMYIPVYYIVFNLIDNKINIEKKFVEIINRNKEGNAESIRYYYYYLKKNPEKIDIDQNKYQNDYITNDNAESFLWAITRDE